MATAGTNGENKVMLPGYAVILSGGKFRFASADKLATHITTTGAAPRKLITTTDDGVLDLPSWKNAIGTKFLTPGASYCVSAGGKIVKGSTGQIIGTALSRTELSISVSGTISRAYDVVSFESGAISVGPLTVGIGPPVSGEGKVGDYRLDLASKSLHGPKTDYGWGTGSALAPTPNDDIWDLLDSTPNGVSPPNLAMPCQWHGSNDGVHYNVLYAWKKDVRAWFAIIP